MVIEYKDNEYELKLPEKITLRVIDELGTIVEELLQHMRVAQARSNDQSLKALKSLSETLETGKTFNEWDYPEEGKLLLARIQSSIPTYIDIQDKEVVKLLYKLLELGHDTRSISVGTLEMLKDEEYRKDVDLIALSQEVLSFLYRFHNRN